MQSKTSFFNRTLYRKNLTRFWPLWGGASLLGALAPLAILMRLIQERFRPHLTVPEVTEAYYQVLAVAVPAVCLVYAVLCAVVVWSYLFNHRSVSLLHTLPLSRKGLFATNILSGLTMMVIPFAVTGALCVLVTAVAGNVAPGALLVTILCVLGESLFYFASATLIAFITGSGVVMVVLYFIFHFLAAGLELLFSELASGFYFGVVGSYTGVSRWLSPTVAFYQRVTYSETWEDVPKMSQLTGTEYISSVLKEVRLEGAWVIALYALVGAGMLALAWLLYRRRRSESAGDVVAVGWMKPVFRYGCAVCAALAGGMLLYTIFWSEYQEGSFYDFLPMLICMVLAGLMGYYIASMLLAKSVRVFRHTWKGAVITAAAVTVLCGAAALDVLGVQNRVPDPADVEAVWLYTGNLDGTLSKEEDIQKVIAVHRAILAEKDQFLANENRAYGDAGWDKASFHVEYRLKNGQGLSRHYYLDYSCEEPLVGAMRSLADLVSDPAMQRANLLRSDIDRFTGGEITCWLTEQGEEGYSAFDAEQARRLYEALQRDIDAGHVGRTAFRNDNTEVYFNDLSLYYQTKESDDGDSHSMPASRTLRLQLSIYCTETIAVLKEEGIVDSEHLLLTWQERDQMQGRDQWDDGYWDVEKYGDYSVSMHDGVSETAEAAEVIGGADGPTEIFLTNG